MSGLLILSDDLRKAEEIDLGSGYRVGFITRRLPSDRNGSSASIAFHKSGYLLTVLADGSRKSSHGPEAAKMLVDGIANAFYNAYSIDQTPEEFLQKAIQAGHKKLREQFHNLTPYTTVCASAIHVKRKRIVSVYVGDTVGFLYGKTSTKNIGTPQTRTEPVLDKNGRVEHRNSAPVMKRGLLQIVGRNGDIKPDVASSFYTTTNLYCNMTYGVNNVAISRLFKSKPGVIDRESFLDMLKSSKEAGAADAALLYVDLGESEAKSQLKNGLMRYCSASDIEKEILIKAINREQYYNDELLINCIDCEDDEEKLLFLINYLSRCAFRKSPIPLHEVAENLINRGKIRAGKTLLSMI